MHPRTVLFLVTIGLCVWMGAGQTQAAWRPHVPRPKLPTSIPTMKAPSPTFNPPSAPVSREPKSLMDQMVLGSAQQGSGRPIIKNLGDRRFTSMEKWSYTEVSDGGLRSTVNYVHDPKTGIRTDFKFKDHAVLPELPKRKP